MGPNGDRAKREITIYFCANCQENSEQNRIIVITLEIGLNQLKKYAAYLWINSPFRLRHFFFLLFCVPSVAADA